MAVDESNKNWVLLNWKTSQTMFEKWWRYMMQLRLSQLSRFRGETINAFSIPNYWNWIFPPRHVPSYHRKLRNVVWTTTSTIKAKPLFMLSRPQNYSHHMRAFIKTCWVIHCQGTPGPPDSVPLKQKLSCPMANSFGYYHVSNWSFGFPSTVHRSC